MQLKHLDDLTANAKEFQKEVQPRSHALANAMDCGLFDDSGTVVLGQTPECKTCQTTKYDAVTA